MPPSRSHRPSTVAARRLPAHRFGQLFRSDRSSRLRTVRAIAGAEETQLRFGHAWMTRQRDSPLVCRGPGRFTAAPGPNIAPRMTPALGPGAGIRVFPLSFDCRSFQGFPRQLGPCGHVCSSSQIGHPRTPSLTNNCSTLPSRCRSWRRAGDPLPGRSTEPGWGESRTDVHVTPGRHASVRVRGRP